MFPIKQTRAARIISTVMLLMFLFTAVVGLNPTTASADSPANVLGRTWGQGSVSFKPFVGPEQYSIVYTPLSNGGGFYYQPSLPAPGQRVENKIAIVVQPGVYLVFGWGCSVWFNNDQQHGNESGWLMAVNTMSMELPATAGKNESWVMVWCNDPSASFSMFPIR